MYNMMSCSYLLGGIHHCQTTAIAAGEGEQHSRDDKDIIIVEVDGDCPHVWPVVAQQHEWYKNNAQDDQDVKPTCIRLQKK